MKLNLTKLWAFLSIILICTIIIFLFGYTFIKGFTSISIEFITEQPSGLILGEKGGIFPAIIGSLYFTIFATIIGGLPALCTAIYLNFFCNSLLIKKVIHSVIQCISGIPSIVLGLFVYSFIIKSLKFNRSIFCSSVALGIMILPFVENQIEKDFSQIPISIMQSATSLGFSKLFTIYKIILPQCIAQIISALVLGGCFAIGATAPLMFTGAVAFAKTPKSIFEPAMALPMHLYLLVAQGANSIDIAYATALVMLFILLILSLTATFYSRRHKTIWQ